MGLFPLENFVMFTCERNYFVLQRKLQFFLLERVKCGMYQCNSMNNVEEELFHFQLCFIYCKSI